MRPTTRRDWGQTDSEDALIQSASAAPGIDTAPPSVGQVPMTDDVPTDSATVSVDVSMLPVEDSGYVDDDDS